MAGGTAQQLKLRLFLEGVEVPVIAASIQCAPNSPSMCSLQLPPLPEGTRFFPRTLVHLFFLDFYATSSPFVSARGGSSSNPTVSKDPTTYQQALLESDTVLSDVKNHRYKLLFGGEVMGFQWTKNERNRSLVLQCQDWSNYWDYAYQWNNTDLFGPGIKAIFSGGSTNLFTDFLSDEGSDIIRIIQQPSVQYPKLKGLLGGLIHLLEAIGGSYYYGKKFSGQNIFYSLAELRLHVTQMITAYEADPTASRLLNADGYDGLFGRTLGGLGQQVSFRQAINALMGIIFHETYSIPTPLYTPGTGGSVSGVVRTPISKDPRYSNVAKTAQDMIDGIDQLLASIAAPAEPIGTGGSDAVFVLGPKRLQTMQQTLKTFTNQLRDPAVQSLKGFLSSASTALGVARTKILKGVHAGASSKAAQSVSTPLNEAKGLLRRAVEYDIPATTSKGGVPARLNQQIFRPDVWFSAPPRCNVLFPEHYNTISYQRMFMQEPTRFLLKTNDEFFGEDELFDQFYVAPRATTVKGGKSGLGALLDNDILDHELFTGILPVFEKMGELNIFAARSGTVNGKQPKVGLAQRSANFLYFKHRFAARQMNVNARFNPYIAPGFPGLVIDKWSDAAAMQQRQALIDKYGGTNTNIDKLLGTHFLGNFTEVSHNIDQTQGRTDIVLSYPRQPEESTEFLGITGDQVVKKRFGQDALRSTDVAGIDPPRPLSIGPNFGQITKVTDVTRQYTSDGSGGAPVLPVFQGPRREGTGEARVRVPVGLTQKASEYGDDVVALVGDKNVVVTFRAFRVEEEVPRYRKEVVDLPAEEYIRPGWYGDCWHPSAVGKVYQQFFQTGAITDFQQVSDPNGASVGVPSQEAEDALAAAANGVDFDDPRTNAPALLSLDKDSSIQAAVGFIVQVYSYVKLGGLDVDEFIRSYVWRPVASMVDMFGSSDLQISPDGHQVVQGIEGFHSRAFGPYADLFGLVTPDIEGVTGIKRGSTVAQKADVRGRKQNAVREYVSQLQFARAILG